jgi:hypothetical protein
MSMFQKLETLINRIPVKIQYIALLYYITMLYIIVVHEIIIIYVACSTIQIIYYILKRKHCG